MPETMSIQTLPFSLLPARHRSTFLIKILLIILTLAFLFYIQFHGAFNGKTDMKPVQELKGPGAAGSEMTVEVVMRSVLDSLPKTTNFSSLESSSSGRHSVVDLQRPGARYCVGDTLSVRVNMRDYRANPKARGGDFILARIHSPKLQASASGRVTDLLNGSYSVSFQLFWPGDVLVSVLLVHSSEAVGILRRVSAHNYHKIIYTGTFQSGQTREESRCGVRLSPDTPLCEYRRKEDAEYYACVRPPTLPCDALKTMRAQNGPIPNMTADEHQILSQTHTGVPIRNSFGPVKVISCPARTLRPTEKCAVGLEMTSPLLSGYFFKNRWSSASCRAGSFFAADDIARCLTGKTLKLMGDSTVRQWQHLLMDKFKGLKYVEPYDTHYFARSVDPKRNITVQWKMHGHPFVTGYNVVKDACGYTYRELDQVAPGEVVVIGVGQHFRPFPLEVFIQRLLNIRRAIVRLQERSPETPIVIKLENTRELGMYMAHLSDWFGYVQNLAQRLVFRDLRVALVDAWDMTTAANTFATHPNKVVVSNQLSLALSHFCQYA